MDTNTKLREEMQKEKQKTRRLTLEKLMQDHFDDKEAAKCSIKRYNKAMTLEVPTIHRMSRRKI